MRSAEIIFFCIFAILLLKFEAVHSKCCYIDNLYKMFGTKTDYDEVRAHNNERDFIIEGCHPYSIWFLTRHGSRYPDSTEIKELSTNLPLIQKAIVDSKSNNLCDKENGYIKNWQPVMTEFDDHNITVVGEMEMIQLAHRFRQRFINILDDENSLFYARAAINRTQATIGHFLDEFFKKHPHLTPAVEIDRKDKILDYISSCKKFKEFEKNKTYCRYEKNFTKTERYKNNIQLLMNKLNLKKVSGLKDENVFDTVYKTCIYEYMIKNRTDESKAWCAPFTRNILKAIEFRDDLEKHCQYGHKYKISNQMTCELRKNLLQHLRSVLNPDSQIINTLFFTQGSAILPFLTSLDLYKGPLYTRNYDEVYYRQWKSSSLDSMNANVIFVTYKCNDDSLKFKAFHNEKPINFPYSSCDSNSICDINKFIEHLAIDTDTCDFDSLCKGSVTDEDLVNPVFNI